MQLKKTIILAYVTWNRKKKKKRNFHILAKLIFKYNWRSYNNFYYTKNKNQGFSFIWIFDLGALSAASGGISFSFSLRAPSASKVVEASSFSESWKAAQVEEPQLLYSKRSLSGFHFLDPYPVNWMREDAEAGPFRLAGRLEELPLSDLGFVGQEERWCSQASSAQKKHQSQLDWELLPKSECSRHNIQWGPLPLGHPRSQLRRRCSLIARPHLFPSQLWPWLL